MAAKSSTTIEKALQKIQEQITCGICLETYTNPKLLNCYHVFCEKCLQSLVDGGRWSLTCPNCRHQMQLPVDGVPSLQGAFYINNLFDIQDILQKVSSSDQPTCNKCKKNEAVKFCRACGLVCQSCVDTHKDWDDLSSHDIIGFVTLTGDVTTLIPPLKKKLFCLKHSAKEADFYCDECDKLICHYCTLTKDHRDHKHDLVTESFAKHEKEILTSIKPVEDQSAKLTKAIESVDAECAAIKGQKTAVVAEIHTITQAQNALKIRQTELIGLAEELEEQKLQKLKVQREDLKKQLSQRRSCQDFVDNNRRTCSQGEILRMKSPLMKRINELNGSFKTETMDLVERADLKFAHSVQELTETCQQFGKVYCHPVCPEKCHVSGEIFKLVTRGQVISFCVEALDSEGEACIRCVDGLMCKLVSNDGSSQVRGTVKRIDVNRYNITYQPQQVGRCQLHILIEKCPILNSPFNIIVQPNLIDPSIIIVDLDRPRGIAVTNGGDVIVAERYSHCVSIISANGEKKSFGSQGSANGEFNSPKNVVVDAKGNILVVDFGNHRIQQLSSTGKHLKTVGTSGGGSLQFQNPRSIAMHPDMQKVYVVDTGNHRIQVLNSNFTYSSSFGSRGYNNGEFNEPYDISIDSAGNVYIADMNNHRIQVFTSEGKYFKQFGKKGKGYGELNQPISVAVDCYNTVYVGEYWNSRISIFSTDGKFIKSFGRGGNGRGQFNSPYGIALHRNGAVYVSDTANHRIQIFS